MLKLESLSTERSCGKVPEIENAVWSRWYII